MSASTTTFIEKYISNLKKSCEMAVKYDYEANLEQFLKFAAEIAEVDLRNKHMKEALQKDEDSEEDETELDRVSYGYLLILLTRNGPNQKTEDETVISLCQYINLYSYPSQAFQEAKETNFDTQTIKQHKIYTDFERFVRDLLSKQIKTANNVALTTVDNDMEITETSRSAIDPLTKGPLLRPVRNIHCGHTYGYQSVMDSLQINPRLRCPMVGCSNKVFIKSADLIEL
ncbi:E3 SUMO-protein ligase NSE2 [Pseudolycoriella hygida]|uniref:E3 SUMO-protein ligase NSE2 n=1 Tax=Pseudolycoriella hygida TaxID=35572 RepID=A0A9Q0S4F4_9DIPT|nr:E3 SUMO-protein ligase NSE2 [Pseudolycoriella hygida]